MLMLMYVLHVVDGVDVDVVDVDVGVFLDLVFVPEITTRLRKGFF